MSTQLFHTDVRRNENFISRISISCRKNILIKIPLRINDNINTSLSFFKSKMPKMWEEAIVCNCKLSTSSSGHSGLDSFFSLCFQSKIIKHAQKCFKVILLSKFMNTKLSILKWAF